MANKYEVMFNIAAQVNSNFKNSFGSAEKAVRQVAIKVQELQTKADNVQALIKLRNDTKELSSEYFKHKRTLEQLQIAMSKTVQPSKVLTNAYKQTEKAVLRTKKALDQNMATMRTMNRELGASGKSVRDLSYRYDTLSNSLAKAKRQQARLEEISEKEGKIRQAKSLTNSGLAASYVAVTGIANAISAFAKGPVEAAMKIEDAMADVRKVVDFDTPEGPAKLQKELQALSLRIPMTTEGLMQIAAAAGQAGIQAGNLATFTEQAAKMGVAFDISAAEAGEMMSKWQSGMNLTFDQVTALADATNALSNSNAAQAKQIGETLKRYGALGKVAGLTELQTAALAATVISSGAEAEVAATGINAFMRALGRGSSMTSKQALAFANVGFDPKQLQRDLQVDAPKTILAVLNSIKGNVPKELQMEYLTAMFGEEGARAMGPMLANTELLEANFAKVADSLGYAGSMQKEFEARSDTMSNSLVLLNNAVNTVRVELGGAFMEVIRDNLGGLTALAKSVGDWIRENKELVIAASKVIGSMSLLLIGFHALRMLLLSSYTAVLSIKSGLLVLNKIFITLTNLTKVHALAMTAWSTACKAATATMAFLTKGVRLLGVALKFAATNPIGLAITAIAALVAAGTWLYKNWDMVEAKASQVWQNIANAAKAPINYVIDLINRLINAINSIASFKVPDWVPGIGGKSVSANIPNIPQLANGGIATKPALAMVGEGRESEAIMPLSQLSSMLGAGVGGGITVNYAPVIQVSGGGNVRQEVEQGLRAGQTDLRRELERLLKHEQRLSY